MPKVTTSTGATLDYEDLGTGTPLILLHGLLGTARIDLGVLIEPLSQHFRVLAVTFRGYGESAPKPRRFPPNFYEVDARDVLAFMDALNLQKAHIAGYSDGGEVALLAAALAPERFHAVAVWGSMGLVPPELLPDSQDLGTVPGVEDIQEVMRDVHGIDDPVPVMTEWEASYRGLIERGGDVSASMADRLTMPVLLIVGDADPMAPLHYVKDLAMKLPNGQLEVVSGGHAVHTEHTDALIGLITGFFTA